MGKKEYEGILKDNAGDGAELVGQFLRGEISAPTLGDRLKHSSLAITQYQRYLATKGAYVGLNFQVARALAKDRDELSKMVKQPDIPK